LSFFVDHLILDKVIQLFDDNNDNVKYWSVFWVSIPEIITRSIEDTFMQNGVQCYGM